MIIPPWAYLAGGALALTAAFGTGWTVRGWRCDAQIASIERQLQEARDKAQDRADQSSATYEADRAALDTRAYETRTIIRETFREIPVPAECAAPVAVADSLRASVDATNAAITGKPSPAVRPAAAPADPAD
jgi:hypothetical protein